jgi:peptidoglycan/LPS O-acetylase OafA/YrhL
MSSEERLPTAPGRLEQLDSLRGLAALSVVFYHQLLAYPAIHGPQADPSGLFLRILFSPPIYFFWSGHAAVMLFFVLSGYVLTLPFLKSSRPTYPIFVLKRICRIYIPYVVAMTAAMTLAQFFVAQRIQGLSDWFHTSWKITAQPQQILDHLILIREFDTAPFNNPIWSLIHEMRISLVFPAMAYVIVRLPWWVTLPSAVGLSGVGIFANGLPGLQFLSNEYWKTVHYAAMFVLGGSWRSIAKPSNNYSSSSPFDRKSYSSQSASFSTRSTVF